MSDNSSNIPIWAERLNCPIVLLKTAEQVTKIVDFFSQSGGLSSRNSSFLFNATIDNKFVFTGTKTFTLASGSNLSDPNPTLFQF